MDQLSDALPNIFAHRAFITRDAARVSKALTGKRVLITGAGGSIGSALAEGLLEFAPSTLTLLDSAENNLFMTERALFGVGAGTRLFPVLGDVADERLLDEVFGAFDPQIIFHAAAYKHVPFLERQPAAAVRNNVCGTYTLLKKAGRHGASRVVLLSTDKAVNPVSILGVSKRIAELITAALGTAESLMTSVRFGNVIGSRGSFLPLFAEQVSRRTAVTVTHPEATRYFLSVKEAVNLILEATWLGAGGDILVPELGPPVKILHVAEGLIRQAGLEPYGELPIVFTGLRPGEKMHEELSSGAERPARTETGRLYRIMPGRRAPGEIEELISELGGHLARRDLPALIEKVCRTVPEYRPSGVVSRAARG